MSDTPKIIRLECADCGHQFVQGEELTAPSPFGAEETLYACPDCRHVGDFKRLCDEPGCDNEGCSGTPYPGGYKFHCHEHPPGWCHASVLELTSLLRKVRPFLEHAGSQFADYPDDLNERISAALSGKEQTK